MQMRVYSENCYPISSNAVIKDTNIKNDKPNVWIFEGIQLKDILVNNVVVIINFIEFKSKPHGSNTNELLGISKE